MSLDQLTYFCVAVEQGSMQKAAEVLFTFQPNISRAIKQLEDELGFSLLKRGKNGIHLTPKGEIVYKYAKSTIVNADSLKQIAVQLAEKPNTVSGNINICAAPSYSRTLFTIVKQFVQKFPSVKICVENFESNHILSILHDICAGKELANHKKDTIYLTHCIEGDIPIFEGYHLIPLGTSEIAIAAGPYSPLNVYKERISLKSLSAVPLMVYQSREDSKTLYEEVLEQRGAKLDNLIHFNSMDLIRRFLSDGMYAAISLKDIPDLENNYYQLEDKLQLQLICFVPEHLQSDYITCNFLDYLNAVLKA